MNLFRNAGYAPLLALGEHAPLSESRTQSLLVPMLRNWKSPLTESGSDVNSNGADVAREALERLDPRESTLAYAQVAVDCARSNQRDLAALAFRRLASAGRLAQFEQFPVMLQRVADAAGAGAFGAADACALLADVAEALLQQMQETASAGPVSYDVQPLAPAAGVRLTPVAVECARQCVLARRAALHARVSRLLAAYAAPGALGRLVGTEGVSRARAFMEFSLYAGMVHAAHGADGAALAAWQRVLAVPSRHVSAVAVAAFKRRLLLHAAALGTRARPPACFAAAHVRILEAQAAPYVAVADACAAATTLATPLAKLSDMRRVLAHDENAGLAARLVHAMPAHCIRRRARVYAAVPLPRLAELIGFAAHPLARDANTTVDAALAAYIRDMDDPAVILDADQIVRFQPSSSGGADAECRWADAVEQKAAHVAQLRDRMDRLDRHLALTKECVMENQRPAING
ncbi:hypothetical protein GGI04_002856 [Coemansia thaxteri]|nr:hypothetical protein GGI04_002856 [Coemansia thaxteri]KAJ2469783.1 hypothetical protein GGI02_003313 [Coemansia sp. RSA 2322]